jgi:hypothetical protein
MPCCGTCTIRHRGTACRPMSSMESCPHVMLYQLHSQQATACTSIRQFAHSRRAPFDHLSPTAHGTPSPTLRGSFDLMPCCGICSIRHRVAVKPRASPKPQPSHIFDQNFPICTRLPRTIKKSSLNHVPCCACTILGPHAPLCSVELETCAMLWHSLRTAQGNSMLPRIAPASEHGCPAS